MPTISGKDALKILEKKGFKIRKGRGSHIVVSRPDISPFVVPLHKELKTGTLNHIIKNSKDFKEDFYQLKK